MKKKIWVVDYKTGSPKNEKEAFEQLKKYAQALQKSHSVSKEEKLYLAVIYPLLGKTQIQPYQEGQ